MSGILERDEFGRVLRASLDPERAAELGRMPKKADLKALANLLAEAGYPSPDQAPEHLRLLASLAVGGRSGAVAALRDFRRLVGQDKTEAEGEGLRPVQFVDAGGRYAVIDGNRLYRELGPDEARELLGMLGEIRKGAKSLEIEREQERETVIITDAPGKLSDNLGDRLEAAREAAEERAEPYRRELD